MDAKAPATARHGVPFAANCLGWELLAQERTQGTSLMVSPASIMMCLGLLGGGAEVQAQEAFFSNLGAPTAEKLRSALSGLLKAFKDDADETITGWNAVYFDGSCEVNPVFEQHLKDFQAVLSQKYDALPDATDEINLSVSEKTRGMITQLVSREDLKNAHTVFLNAMSFKGFWASQFDKQHTVEDYPFQTNPQACNVPMMFLKNEHVLTAQGPGYTAACLPYKKATPSAPSTWFLGYLPDPDTSVNSILPKLRAGHEHFVSEKHDTFGLPRIEIESSLELSSVLTQLGYLPTTNFPQMGTGNHLVSAVIHKTKIEVDEEGTRAAAATAAVMTRCLPAPGEVLIFDRPFVFSIVDERGLALFTGVFSPTG